MQLCASATASRSCLPTEQARPGRPSGEPRATESRAIGERDRDRDGADAEVGIRPALRQTEGLIGSIIALLGLDLAVPDHTTLSCRAESLEVVCPRSSSGPVHLTRCSSGQPGNAGMPIADGHR
jgi:hypothetical protein